MGVNSGDSGCGEDGDDKGGRGREREVDQDSDGRSAHEAEKHHGNP